jgi:hypothetical protein
MTAFVGSAGPAGGEAIGTAIEPRLAEIPERQHALAVEKASLVEQMTPLRLGVALARSGPGPAESEGHRLAWRGRGEGVRSSFFGDPLEIGRPTAEERPYPGA